MQTGGQQLIGAVKAFRRNDNGEYHRRLLVDAIKDDHYIAKAVGHRVYITLAASLRPIEPEDMPTPAEIKKILGEMAAYYMSSLKPADRERFTDRGPWEQRAEDADASDNANRW